MIFYCTYHYHIIIYNKRLSFMLKISNPGKFLMHMLWYCYAYLCHGCELDLVICILILFLVVIQWLKLHALESTWHLVDIIKIRKFVLLFEFICNYLLIYFWVTYVAKKQYHHSICRTRVVYDLSYLQEETRSLSLESQSGAA